MKTTLEIDDELYRAVKAKAALEGKRVTDLVAEGLRLALQEPEVARVRVKLPLIAKGDDGPMITMEDVKRAQDQLDQEEAEAIALHLRR